MGLLEEFEFRRKLTIDNTKVDAVLTNVPLLVKLEKPPKTERKAENG